MTASLELGKTSRGFGKGTFADAKKQECSIQDSSLATEAAIWFGVEDANPQILVGDTLQPVPPPVKPIPISGWPGLTHDILINTRMHLTIRMTKTLIRNFEKYLATGTVRKRTFVDRYGCEASIRLTDGLIELGCDNPNPQICDNGWRPVKYPDGTIFNIHMFLGREEVEGLLPHMKRFAEGGYVRQDDPEPGDLPVPLCETPEQQSVSAAG